MSSSEIAVSVRGLGKSYTIAHQNGEKHNTLAETLLDRVRHPFRRTTKETFWALKDVSFDIKAGEVVGIVGRNGAGKSTLLKLLSQITEPTSGEIELNGRVGSLLEVGTGFHGELTGRENIFLNGAILGMSKAEIRKQFDAIVDFAGVEQFLDTPVKRYSSGMYVRLAFAVAAHLSSDILIIDEVLAVGDATFQQKCLAKVGEVTRDGRTTILVSHNIAVVRNTCTKGIYLKSGKLVSTGTADEIADLYDSETDSQTLESEWTNPDLTPDNEADIERVSVLDASGRPITRTLSSRPVVLRFTILVRRSSPVLKFGFDLIRNGNIVFRSNQVDTLTPGSTLTPGRHTVDCVVPANLLFSGLYRVRPHMSLHCIRWLFNPPEPTLLFEVNFDSRGSEFQSLLSVENHAGDIYPQLDWVKRESTLQGDAARPAERTIPQTH
jgi:lipopolysaccharide transport system ATP-binding protein